MKKAKSLVLVSLLLPLAGLSPAATVTDVAVSPRWPWEDKVDVAYTLDAETYGGYAVTVALYDGDRALDVAAASLPGNGGIRLPGRRRQVFDFALSGLAERPKALRAVVTASEKPVRYMVIDLTKSVGEEGQREYVWSGDERLESHADFEVSYRVSDDPEDGTAVTHVDYEDVWFAVTNDSQYATTKMVFRFVSPQNSVLTGYGDVTTNGSYVTLTKAYWITVFPMTQGQYGQLKWGNPARQHMDPNWGTQYVGVETQLKPMQGTWRDYAGAKYAGDPYDDTQCGMRGPLGDPNCPIGWPLYGHAVSPTNTLAAFREKTGLQLDYPTEAQWEIACRAGTTGLYGDKDSKVANTNLLMRFASVDYFKKVGDGRLPNGWGLYDMLGNLGEAMLDAFVEGTGTSGVYSEKSVRISGFDPVGVDGLVATTNKARIVRGLAAAGSVQNNLQLEVGTRITTNYALASGDWGASYRNCMRWVVELDD